MGFDLDDSFGSFIKWGIGVLIALISVLIGLLAFIAYGQLTQTC